MTANSERSVDEYIASLDEQTAHDSRTLIEMMRRVSGQEPTLWNVGTIGFGTYHYKYYCVYIKRLSDVELPVLEQIVRDSYGFVKSKSQEGPIRQILWKAEG